MAAVSFVSSGDPFLVGMGAAYVLMGVLNLAPAIFLWRYASRIATYLRVQSMDNLASALEAQKAFWRFVGIAMLVLLIVYGVLIIFAIFAGAFAASQL